MTITLSATQEQELAEIGGLNGLTPEETVVRAIDQFLAYREDLEAAVNYARVAVAQGKVHEHAAVVERIGKLLSS